MALSQDMKDLYGSVPTDQIALDTIQLSHSLFTQTYYFVNRNTTFTAYLEDLTTQVSYEPMAFVATLPEKGSNQQDLQFTFDNVNQLGVIELENAAEAIDEPIVLTYRPYIDTDTTTPQATPIELNLTNIVVMTTTITASASRSSMIERRFPTRNFDTSVFQGLA